MRLAKNILSTVALLALPALALAQPSYTHLDLGYNTYTPKRGSTQDGLSIGGSLAFSENLHAVAAYSDLSSTGVDNSVATLMLGHRIPVSERSDFVVRGGWMEQRRKTSGNRSNTSDGYVLMLGSRNMVTENIELNAWGGVHRTSRSRASIGLEGVYHLSESFSGFAGIDSGNSSAHAVRAGVRINF